MGGGPCQARGSGRGLWTSPAPARGVQQGAAPSQGGAPRRRLLVGGGGAFAVGAATGVGRCLGRRRRGSLRRLGPGWPPGRGWPPRSPGWCPRSLAAALPGFCSPGGGAVPRGDSGGQRGREVRPVWRLGVRRVVRAGRVGGGGAARRCCVRGLVMGFRLVAAGGGAHGRARRRGAGAVGACGCLRVTSCCLGPGWGA